MVLLVCLGQIGGSLSVLGTDRWFSECAWER